MLHRKMSFQILFELLIRFRLFVFITNPHVNSSLVDRCHIAERQVYILCSAFVSSSVVDTLHAWASYRYHFAHSQLSKMSHTSCKASSCALSLCQMYSDPSVTTEGCFSMNCANSTLISSKSTLNSFLKTFCSRRTYHLLLDYLSSHNLSV